MNRTGEALGSPRKRSKPNPSEKEIKAKNWSLACEQVSSSQYFDFRTRFQLVYLPSCMTLFCKHKKNVNIKQMPTYAEESFKTEIRNNMWYDALEVCHMCINETRYLSSDVLQEVVEIILNVHEDKHSDYTAKYIIDKCQQILMQNFSTHPPCQDNLWNCYVKFLTSTRPPKKSKYIKRKNQEAESIVQFCMNSLEYELSANSIDGPLIDTSIPEELRDTVKGYHWQKQNFEIFESLNREERIKRLFAVLATIIEVLQFDLAIQLLWLRENQRRPTRRKTLMEHILSSANNTGDMRSGCQQIIRIFATMIHLEYPQAMVKTISTWLNNVIQTIYTRDTNSNIDYPNAKKNCITFAADFYNIIADLPHSSIIRILERIEPSYMRHTVGLYYLNKILTIDEGCVIKIFQYFLLQPQWKSYPSAKVEIKLLEKLFYPPTRVKDKMNYLLSKCISPASENSSICIMPKKDSVIKLNKTSLDLNHIIHTLYITLYAYLDAHKLQAVQDTWNDLNKQMLKGSVLRSNNSYSVSEEFQQLYKHDLNSIKELASLFNDLKKRGHLPKIFNIFNNIKLLELQNETMFDTPDM